MTSIFDIEVTVGKDIKNNRVHRQKLTEELLLNHTIFKGDPDVDKNGMYLCPGLMSGNKRGDQYLEQCNIVALDIDTMTPSSAARVEWATKDTGIEHVMYTTTRHTRDEPRYRILFNPSRLMNKFEYACVAANLAKLCAIDVLDPCCLAPSQPQFLPMVWEPLANQAMAEYTPGKPLDVDAFCANLKDFRQPEEYVPYQTLDPLPVPGGLCQSTWLACVFEAFKAEGLEYHEWLYAGFAIYHQTYGEGFQVWHDWSAKNIDKHCIKVKYPEMLKKWKSAAPDIKRKGLTMRYVLNRRNTAGRSVNARALSLFLNHCTRESELAAIKTDIGDDDFLNKQDRAALATAIKKNTKRITGDEVSTGEVMAQIRNDLKYDEPKRYFHDKYMFNKTESQYYDITTKETVPITSMNYMYGERMPYNASGDHKIVHRVLTTEVNGFVKPRLMAGVRYQVHGPDVISENGQHYLNAFDPESWPIVDTPWNPGENAIDKEIEDMMALHFKLICNGDERTIRFLHQHLAHLRQRPHDRMHFAYAISSHHHGVGKSTLRRLYAATLGEAQTRIVTADEIANRQFNAFAGAPVLMSFIEEFEFDSRREQNVAIKRMKDLITSDVVSVTSKFKDPKNTPSYTAYAIFSNDEYVLGHEATGRRWVPIVCESVTKQQCIEVLGEDDLEFYRKYHALLDSHSDRFAAYFDQLSLEGFDKQNPPSEIKSTVYQDSVPAARVKRLIEEIMDENITYAISPSYASASAIFLEVRQRIECTNTVDTDALKRNDARSLRHLVNLALRMMGYVQCLKQGGEKRVRMPFPDAQRTRMDEIWIKDYAKYGGSDGVKRLRRHVEKAKANFEEQHSKRKQDKKVVGMDGQPYDF